MSRRATAAEPVARRALLARLLAEEAERALTVLASHGQKRLWFAMRSAPGSPVYNCPLTIEVRGSIDPKALSSALSILVDRHEALRTTFKEEDGELYQIVAPRGHLPLERHDLAGDERVDLPRRRLDARAYAKRFARAAFDLRRGPLYRAALVSVSTEENFILLNAHHIVSDGWSQGTLLRELLAGYHASLRGTTPELPSLPLTYSDVAQWESKREVPSETLAYWRTALADVEPLRLLPRFCQAAARDDGRRAHSCGVVGRGLQARPCYCPSRKRELVSSRSRGIPDGAIRLVSAGSLRRRHTVAQSSARRSRSHRRFLRQHGADSR